MEARKGGGRSAPLPHDYLLMVKEVFTTNFDAGLKAVAKLLPKPEFVADGAIYADEILVSVSLLAEGQLSATTVHASTDFDPKASSPTTEDLLSACVDAIGGVYEQLLDPKKPERLQQLAAETMSEMEDVPFEWTEVELDRFRLHVKIDKSNPKLDQMAEDWLNQNDPDRAAREEREKKETEKLFVTGDKAKNEGQGEGDGGPTYH